MVQCATARANGDEVGEKLVPLIGYQSVAQLCTVKQWLITRMIHFSKRREKGSNVHPMITIAQ